MDDEIEELRCGTCRGEAVPMGQLGGRLHFRCRSCGLDWSYEAEDVDDWWNGDES